MNEKYGSDDIKKFLRLGGHYGSTVAACLRGGGLRACGKSACADRTARG